MADWGHKLGFRLCQGIQTWSVWERDSIYRLDLPANEGNFPNSWVIYLLELKPQVWEECTMSGNRHFQGLNCSWITFHPSAPESPSPSLWFPNPFIPLSL